MASNVVGKLCRSKTETGSKQASVGDWMKFMSETIGPNKSVAHARALLLEHGISDLPVMSKGRLVGIVTDRDLQGGALTPAHMSLRKRIESSPDQVRISAVMKAHVLTLAPSDTLAHAAELMRREHVKASPVVEGGHLRGIIHLGDIIDTCPVVPAHDQLDASREASSRVRSSIFNTGWQDSYNDRSSYRTGGKRVPRTRHSGRAACRKQD
jgi:CBS domain-containing protein